MSRILLSIVAAGLFLAVGHALNCYNCELGFWDLCYTTKISCSAGEHCFTGVGKAVNLKIKMKGCLKASECNSTVEQSFLPASSNMTLYRITRTCCDTDLCNAAPALTMRTALPLALTALTTGFMLCYG